MRATTLYAAAWLATAATAVPATQFGDRHVEGRAEQSLDDFLDSVGVEPSAIPSSSRNLTSCRLACAILSAADEDALVTERSDPTRYEEESEDHWSASAWKDPACVYEPTTIDTLSIAVLAAQFTQCQFSVRSGGHSPFPGFAGIDDGILISMSGFTDLSYDPDTGIQRSGMGNRWGDIYEHLADHELLVVGGRINDVGLGLALGGGLSHLSSAYGWVGQNVVSFEVMLANGSHVKASETENPDLYFGSKAAGNNFGIVTHLDQKTYEMGKVWGGTVIYSANYSEDFMAAMADYQQDGQLDTKSAILPYLAVTNDTILSTMVYLDDVEKPDAFAPFYDIPSVQDGTQIYDNFHQFAESALPELPRWTFGVTTVLLDKESYVGLVSVISEFIERVQSLNSGTLALMAQPISKSMVEESRSRGDDPMNVTPEAQLWATINIGWADASDDETVYKIRDECVAAMDEYAKAQGVHDPFRFFNDAAPGQKPLQNYGEESYDRLNAASEKYDPEGVFQTLVPGGFKL